MIQVGKKIGQANYPMRCPHYKDHACDIYETRPRVCKEFPYNVDIKVCQEQGLDLNKVLPETCGFQFIEM
jgi:Fe-S-cluster containining protein